MLEDTNIVTLDFSGSLHVDDEQEIRAALDPVIAAHGSARVLIAMGQIDVGEVEPKALWMDIKGAGYLDDIERAALVSDASWLTKLTEWTGNLAPLEVRTFHPEERDDAMAWLSGA